MTRIWTVPFRQEQAAHDALRSGVRSGKPANATLSPGPGDGRSIPVRARTTIKHLPIVLFAAALAAGSANAQNATAGAAVFKSQCGICHAVTPGKNMIGPSLFGVVGRPAGTVPGFFYSPALKGSGLTWDVATLDRYLSSPATVVPHTIMTYGGLKEPQTRADLIAYLSTLH